ncbi:MAG: hypothetical protein ACREJC_05890 [Tepidisphaeraceae bacterium]
MLMLSGLGSEFTLMPTSGRAGTSSVRTKLATTGTLSPSMVQSIQTMVVAEVVNDLYMQLQCLLNAAMMSPITSSRFAAWQTSDREGWNLVQRWAPLDVDGKIKTGESWTPRRESDTYMLLSRTGIPAFWMGDTTGFGPAWMAANAASLVKTLADFVGPGIANACDFPAIRAAATKAAADTAAAEAAAAAQAAATAAAAQNAAAAEAAAKAAQKAAEEAALLQQQVLAQQQAAAEIAAQQQQQPAGDGGTEPSPGMVVEPAPTGTGPQVPGWTVSQERKRWMKWAAIGAAAIGAGVLVSVLRR